MSRALVAAVQMSSRQDKPQNLAAAERLAEQAAGRGARLVALPEMFTTLGAPEAILAAAEPIPGPTSRAMGELAGRLNVYLLAGTFPERAAAEGRIYNTSLLFAPDGGCLASYRKLHLFDIDLPDAITFRESAFTDPGDQIVAIPTSLGRLGLATCYDLRFPELFRSLVDLRMQLLAVPSAFSLATGRDHWEVLLRARAIENQVYVIAPNQYGQHAPRLATYGRSMIIDPWGTVLATAADGEGVILAEVDLDRLEEVRARLPALEHRRDLAAIRTA